MMKIVFHLNCYQSDRKISKLPKYFANSSLADIKLARNQKSTLVQSGSFLGRHLGPVLKTGLLLMTNVQKVF